MTKGRDPKLERLPAGPDLDAAERLSKRVNLYGCNEKAVGMSPVRRLNEYQIVTELARNLLPTGIEKLMSIISDDATPPMATIKAIELLWNYSYGKPHIREPHNQESKSPVIRVMFPQGTAPDHVTATNGVQTDVIIATNHDQVQESEDGEPE